MDVENGRFTSVADEIPGQRFDRSPRSVSTPVILRSLDQGECTRAMRLVGGFKRSTQHPGLERRWFDAAGDPSGLLERDYGPFDLGQFAAGTRVRRFEILEGSVRKFVEVGES